MLHTVVVVIQVILAIVVCALMAVQTDKTEQAGGGVMGLGAAGGRTTGSIEMLVGAERILKPLTKWTGGAFVAVSLLSSIPAAKLTVLYVVAVLILFVLSMLFGGRIWGAITGSNRTT